MAPPDRTEYFRRLTQETPNGPTGVSMLVTAVRARVAECVPKDGPHYRRAMYSPDKGWILGYERWLEEAAKAGTATEKLTAVGQVVADETAVYCLRRDHADVGDLDAAILAETIAGATQDIESHRVRSAPRSVDVLRRFYDAGLAQVARLKRAMRIAKTEEHRLLAQRRST